MSSIITDSNTRKKYSPAFYIKRTICDIMNYHLDNILYINTPFHRADSGKSFSLNRGKTFGF